MTEAATAQTGSVATALAHAERLLASSPQLALEQAGEVLRALPGHPQARLVRGRALRRLGRINEARAELSDLVALEPRSAASAFELGLVCIAADDPRGAVETFRRAIGLKPDLAEAWRGLAEALRQLGDEEDAAVAHLASLRASTRAPLLLDAGFALVEGRLADAEARLASQLEATPDDTAALRMMGECLARQGRAEAAESALRRALAVFPGFVAARELLARLLHKEHRPAEALDEVVRLRAADPDNPSFAMLEGALLARTGRHEQAVARYRDVLDHYPVQPKGWMSLGHVLKAIGRTSEAIEAYRTAIRQQPSLGEAWWSLANMKTFHFSDGETATLRATLASADNNEDRLHLNFALGKALEDATNSDAEAFAVYQQGARIRRGQLTYDADRAHETCIARTRALNATFFAEREGGGYPASDPIFVVGLPRSGSTLVEQILSSHSQIEGVAELPDLMTIAGRLGASGDSLHYADRLAALSRDARCALGEEYMSRTRVHRRLDRPRFIDKLPNNWMHVGLIRLILPHAKVIDARRHPMACGWSAFTQHFARGQDFSYDLGELGRYYRDYVEAMEGFDAALPGFVHRILHERVVDDLEREVRAMLSYLGLEFEPACLSFWKTERAVRTPSAEQVRRPIFKDGSDRWRRFEPWLAPLAEGLGDAREHYDAPTRVRSIGV